MLQRIIFNVLLMLVTAWNFAIARRREFAIGGGVLTAILAAWIFWPASDGQPKRTAPPVDKMDREQVVAFIGSDEFARQPDSVKIEYVDKLRQLGRPDRPASRPVRGDGPPPEPTAEEKKFHENMRAAFEAKQRKDLNDYFALSEDQRVAYLDKLIDERIARRRPDAQSRPADAPPPPPTSQSSSRPTDGRRDGHGFSPQRMKELIESTPPEERAKREEFMKQLRKRMDERGIKFGGGGGPPPR